MWVRDEEQVTNLAATYGYRVLKKHKYGKVYQKGTIKVIPNHTPKRSVAIIIKSQSPTQQFQFYVTDQMIVGIFKRPHAFHRTGYKDFAEYQNSMARKRTYDMMVNTNHNGTHPPHSKRYSLLQNIGIISPYKPQAKLIRQIWNNMLGPKEDRDRCLIGTSDSFQGNERDIIILSLTNNNIYQNDFINDSKRVNVSLTRCKKCLIVVTSFDYKSVLRQQSVWAHWFKHFDSS
eukprot:274630_1